MKESFKSYWRRYNILSAYKFIMIVHSPHRDAIGYIDPMEGQMSAESCDPWMFERYVDENKIEHTGMKQMPSLSVMGTFSNKVSQHLPAGKAGTIAMRSTRMLHNIRRHHTNRRDIRYLFLDWEFLHVASLSDFATVSQMVRYFDSLPFRWRRLLLYLHTPDTGVEIHFYVGPCPCTRQFLLRWGVLCNIFYKIGMHLCRCCHNAVQQDDHPAISLALHPDECTFYAVEVTAMDAYACSFF